MLQSFPRLVSACVLALISAVSAVGLEPEIRNLPVRGLQIKGTTTITLEGENFGTTPRLLLPFTANVALKPGGNDKQATFDVTLGEDVVAGYHHLRIATDGGVSLPNVIAVDAFPQKALTPSIEQLPIALHGTVSGSNLVETVFQGKANQKVTIEVESKRLGSALRPVLHLYSPKRLQLAWSWAMPSLLGDTRLEATLPEDGAYRITLHDAEYQAPAVGFFRLRVGKWSCVDQVFPPIVGKDTNAVELIGLDTLRADLPAKRNTRRIPLAWPKEGFWSGPRPFVEISTRTEVLEQPSTAKPQELPAGMVGVSGRLAVPHEEDRYRIPVKAGDKFRFEVFADRRGSSIDTALVIRNDAGMNLTRAEDSPGSLDPVLDYTVPANTTALVLAVVDAQGRGGPRATYRLTIDPTTTTDRNDFDLFTPARRVSLPLEGRAVIPVWVERRGYQGPVALSAMGMPANAKLDGLNILADTEGTLVTVTANHVAVTPALSTWQGRAPDARERDVIQKNHPMERLQPWLAAELAVGGATTKGPDFRIEWKDAKDDDVLVTGRRRSFFVKITRTIPAAPVRITLVTSQLPILVNNQPDPNRTIRLAQAIELAPTVNEGEVAVQIPVELAAEKYDISIQAESLTADKRLAVATAFTPVRTLSVRRPINLKVETPLRLDTKLDAKTGVNLEIKGTIERLPGITGEVQLTLTGLPASAQAPPVNVKADANTFVVKITLPPTTPPGEVKGLKLSGSIVPDPKAPNQRVKSKDVEFVLNIVSAK